MKKKILFVFIISVVFYIFSLNNVFSLDNEKVNFVKSKIYLTTEEKGKLYDLIGDINYENAKKEGKVIKFNPIISVKTPSEYWGMEPGDFLVFRYKDGNIPKWSGFTSKWNHASIYYGDGIIGHAIGIGNYSRKENLMNFIIKESPKLEKIAIVKMGLNSYQKYKIKKYIDDYLIGKPYPEKWQLMFKKTRTTMKAFYCSSLIWRAHYSSGRFTDLDEKDPGYFIWPAELFNSNNISSLKFIDI